MLKWLFIWEGWSRGCLAITEGKDSHVIHPLTLLGLSGEVLPLFPLGHWYSALCFISISFFCSYHFPKLMSRKNCSFNYSLLLINYLKINIMLLFPSFPFFHYLSTSCCSLILGVFHDTLMAPAAQQSLSQCSLSPALPSISPSHLSGLWLCHGTGQAPLPAPATGNPPNPPFLIQGC